MSSTVKLSSTLNRKRKALVCEDNHDFNEIMTEFLTTLGFDVKSFEDGLKAATCLKEESFDLIILDIRLPSMNGLQISAVARANEINRNAQIYIITGEADPSISVKANALRVNKFLQKPVNFPSLEKDLEKDFSKETKTSSYDVRIINAFLDAAMEVYEFYFQERPERGKVAIRAQGKPEKGFCTGLIALSGPDFVGSMGVGMTAPFIKKFASTLFANMEVRFDNEFVADITGELCNQIIGKVKFNFAKLGVEVIIGLPKVIMGKDHIIQHKVSNPVVAVVMGKGSALFELQFVLSQRSVKIEERKIDADVPKEAVMIFDDN